MTEIKIEVTYSDNTVEIYTTKIPDYAIQFIEHIKRIKNDK